ncbi:MAG: DUF6494 family protein [Burkholderiaceae bacterium]
MDQENFNLSLRRFLKMVGVNGQRAIEEAVANAIAHGIIADGDTLPSSMTLTIPRINLTVKFDGEIALQ